MNSFENFNKLETENMTEQNCQFCFKSTTLCVCSLDLTEPRLEAELRVADNMMAVEALRITIPPNPNPILPNPISLYHNSTPPKFVRTTTIESLGPFDQEITYKEKYPELFIKREHTLKKDSDEFDEFDEFIRTTTLKCTSLPKLGLLGPRQTNKNPFLVCPGSPPGPLHDYNVLHGWSTNTPEDLKPQQCLPKPPLKRQTNKPDGFMTPPAEDFLTNLSCRLFTEEDKEAKFIPPEVCAGCSNFICCCYLVDGTKEAEEAYRDDAMYELEEETYDDIPMSVRQEWSEDYNSD